jgi:hypothetical protein
MDVVSLASLRVENARAMVWGFGVAVNAQAARWAAVIAYG